MLYYSPTAHGAVCGSAVCADSVHTAPVRAVPRGQSCDSKTISSCERSRNVWMLHISDAAQAPSHQPQCVHVLFITTPLWDSVPQLTHKHTHTINKIRPSVSHTQTHAPHQIAHHDVYE